MDPKITQKAEQELADLESRAGQFAAEITALKQDMLEKTESLGALMLDDPAQADRVSAEIARLDVQVKQRERAQAELARRLVAAQDQLQTARAEDAKQEFAALREQLRRLIPEAVQQAEALFETGQAIERAQKVAAELRQRFGVGTGALALPEQFDGAYFVQVGGLLRQARLEHLTRILKEQRSDAEQAEHERLFQWMYADQIRQNKATAAQLEQQQQAQVEAAQEAKRKADGQRNRHVLRDLFGLAAPVRE